MTENFGVMVTHPELREGEKFIGNSTPADISRVKMHGYDWIRFGHTAYDTLSKEVLPLLQPVFVRESEHNKRVQSGLTQEESATFVEGLMSHEL